jgi:hypothetical protein
MNIKANEVYKITKVEFTKYVYSTWIHPSDLHYITEINFAMTDLGSLTTPNRYMEHVACTAIVFQTKARK